MLDIDMIRRAAEGRWPELLARICGVPLEILDGKHHPCPKCGGKDRFRLIDPDRGALWCNQCFSKGNGDGFAAVMWLTGMQFPDSARRIGEEAGLGDMRSEVVDVVEEMAWRKGITSRSLEAFGAQVAQRGHLTVCRVPMFDADMHRVGDFDMAPSPEEFQKGKMTHGSKHGMFIADPPSPGESIMVVEGVKDASALHALGFKAIGLPTCRMDAGFARLFRGCNVTLIPDRDTAGTDGARESAGRLFGVAATVRIAELPVEFKESGGADVRDVLKLRDGEAKLRDAIANARTWTPGGERAALALVTLDSAVQRFIADLGTEQPLWTTSLPDVDDALSGGVLPGEMVIIAGRPSHGKTVAGLQMLDGLAKTVPVLMVSEEMSLPALAQRSLSGITGINSRDWAAQKERLSREACQHYAGRKPFLVAESCGTADRAIEAIARAKEQYQIGAVAVDYVQMLRGKGDGRYEQVSDTSTRLKQAAVQYGVLLVAICQLNRGVEEGNKPRAPKMSDLRDSGQLEQDADVILFVEWLHRSAPQEHPEDAYRITVAKNRNRGIKRSVIDCVFIAERQVLRPKALAYQEDTAAGVPTRKRNSRPQKFSEFEGFEGNGGEF